jgi:hypothetical protein
MKPKSAPSGVSTFEFWSRLWNMDKNRHASSMLNVSKETKNRDEPPAPLEGGKKTTIGSYSMRHSGLADTKWEIGM